MFRSFVKTYLPAFMSVFHLLYFGGRAHFTFLKVAHTLPVTQFQPKLCMFDELAIKF